MHAAPRCLATEQIARFATGASSIADMDGIQHHVEQCERCRRDVAAMVRAGRTRTACPDALAPGEDIGRYVVLEVLGRGGMGVVYAAWDPQLDRRVAIKLVRAERAGDLDAATRLTREARTLALVSHPNIVTVFDTGCHRDEVFIAMELVVGATLSEWLRQRSRAVPTIVDAFAQAGRGLAAAHAAGLVHRDFKPDNVFVSADDRVLVGDFGLARRAEPNDPTAPGAVANAPAMTAGSSVTTTGAVLGTVAYMAPEQLDGLSASALTDQFSFAVTLYEALYGERPFIATTANGLRERLSRKEPPRWRGNDAVPTWLRDVLARALAREPGARYPSMTALLAALMHDRTRRRRGIALAALVSCLATGAFWLGTRRTDATALPPVCSTASARLAGAWDDAQRHAIHAAFAATARPFAEQAWDATRTALDHYTASWVDAVNGTCDATQVARTQSAELLDRRMACLDRGLAAVVALTGVLAHADARTVEHAPGAATQLPALATCADTDTLLAITAPPRDAAATRAIASVRASLEQARAIDAAGVPSTSYPLAVAAATIADTIGYAPLSAEALLLRGTLEIELDTGSSAVPTLERAVDLAEAGRDDVTRIEAWTALVRHAAVHASFDTAHRAAAHASAVLAHLSGDRDELSAKLAIAEANAYFEQGHYDQAIELLERARIIRERSVGPAAPEYAVVLGNLAAAYYATGRYREARGADLTTLAIRTRTLGPNHPAVAAANNNLGLVLLAAGEVDAAVSRFTAAQTIDEAVYGAGSRQAAIDAGNLAKAYYRAGRAGRAIELAVNALAVLETALGSSHPDVVAMWLFLGQARLDSANFAGAQDAFEHALASRATLGEHHVAVLAAKVSLASLELARGHAGAAKTALTAALDDQLATLGPYDTDVIETQRALARAERSLGDLDSAVTHLEAALAIGEHDFGPASPALAVDLGDLAAVQLQRGELAASARAGQRALALATEAAEQARAARSSGGS